MKNVSNTDINKRNWRFNQIVLVITNMDIYCMVQIDSIQNAHKKSSFSGQFLVDTSLQRTHFVGNFFLFFLFFYYFFFMHFFSGTKHPREDNPNLYYWAEITGLHTQTFNI